MKAAVVEQLGEPLVVHSDWPDLKCGPTDVVLRVEANGICLTDYHVWQGGWPWVGIEPSVPIVLGHEFCGVVEEVSTDVHGFRKGDRVVVPVCHGCGDCEQCRTGHQMSASTSGSRCSTTLEATGNTSRSRVLTSISCGYRVDLLRRCRQHGMPL